MTKSKPKRFKVDPLVREFLLAYAKRVGSIKTNPQKIVDDFCYRSLGYHLVLMAYGWVWGKTGDEVKANVSSVFVQEMVNRAVQEMVNRAERTETSK